MLCNSDFSERLGGGWESVILVVLSVEGPRPEAVTKRAERANGGARATCFEQPEGVYSGCIDARPTKYTSSYSVSTHPGYEA